MRKIFFVICLLAWTAPAALTACSSAATPVTIDNAIHEIDRFLTAWHKAAEVADEATYFGSLAPGAIFLGTDLRERWTNEEFQKWAAPYFQRPSAWTFSASRRQVYLSADGATAWFDEDLVSKSYWPCRGSGVLEKVAGAWKIRQYNLALTIPNETTAAIRPLVEAALRKQAGRGQ